MALIWMLPAPDSNRPADWGRFLDEAVFPGIIRVALLLTHDVCAEVFTWKLIGPDEDGQCRLEARGRLVAVYLPEDHAKRLLQEAGAIFDGMVL